MINQTGPVADALQPVPIVAGGILFLGVPLDTWLLIVSLVIGVFNIFRAGVWVYDRFIKDAD